MGVGAICSSVGWGVDSVGSVHSRFVSETWRVNKGGGVYLVGLPLDKSPFVVWLAASSATLPECGMRVFGIVRLVDFLNKKSVERLN